MGRGAEYPMSNLKCQHLSKISNQNKTEIVLFVSHIRSRHAGEIARIAATQHLLSKQIVHLLFQFQSCVLLSIKQLKFHGKKHSIIIIAETLFRIFGAKRCNEFVALKCFYKTSMRQFPYRKNISFKCK